MARLVKLVDANDNELKVEFSLFLYQFIIDMWNDDVEYLIKFNVYSTKNVDVSTIEDVKEIVARNVDYSASINDVNEGEDYVTYNLNFKEDGSFSLYARNIMTPADSYVEVDTNNGSYEFDCSQTIRVEI